MKKLIYTFAVLMLVLSSCSSDDSKSNPLSNNPEANADYNASNYGIYKGVMVGSSGVVFVNINNNGHISAKMIVDGSTHNFTTEQTVALGEETDLTFTNGDEFFTFHVGAGGEDPAITDISMEGHPFAFAEIVKEFSDSQVKCFQGNYTGDVTGVFNLILIENNFYGLAKPDTSEDAFWIEATSDGSGNIEGTFMDGTFTGTIDGNSLSGNWSNTSAESGSWSGERTL